MSREAFVSLVTNDNYATGALALGKSLRDSATDKRLALLITNGVSQDMRGRLSGIWDELILIEELDSGDVEHLALLTRPELGVTFTKIHAWKLTQYFKCVFIDADALVLQNVDELFDREELSAAPDIGWPDCFNSGVFVFEPSLETFKNLLDLACNVGSFDGGDQGLLNLYWGDWATKDIKHHLPFIYNVVPNVTYGYAPAFLQFGRNAKIIHFIGPVKPWQHRYLPEMDSVILYPGTYSSQHAALDFIKRWWQVYASVDSTAQQRRSDPHWWSLSPSPPSHSPYHPTSHDTYHSYVYIPVPHIATYYLPPPTSPAVIVAPSNSYQPSLDHTPSIHHTPPSYHIPHDYLSLYSYVGYYCSKGSTGEDDDITRHLVTDPVHSYHNIPPPDHVQESVEGEAAHGESHQQDFESHQQEFESHQRDFENGKIDYSGQDSFENIQAHLDSILKS